MLPIQPLLMRNPSSVAPTLIRAQGSAQWSGQTTVTAPIPSGSLAGDTIFIFTGASFDTNLVSGFTSLDQQTGINANGRIQYKVLTSGDISAGSFSVTLTGNHAGVMWILVLKGAVTVRTVASTRNSSAASTRTVTTDGTPTAGDSAFYFGYARGGSSTVITPDRGSESIVGGMHPSSNAAGSAYKEEPLASSGSYSVVFGFSSVAGQGDYCAILVAH